MNSTELADDETSADPICMDIELEGESAVFRLLDGVDPISWGLFAGGGAAQTGITDLILTAGAILCGLNPPVYMFRAIVGALTEVGVICDGFGDPKILLIIWLASVLVALPSMQVLTFPVLDIGTGLYIEVLLVLAP